MSQSLGQSPSPFKRQPESEYQPLVLPLEAAGLEAIAAVGGKNASLGELLRELGFSEAEIAALAPPEIAA